MLVVDLMHEFELGVWKAILTHLLRILDSLKGNILREIDQRKVPYPSLCPSYNQLICILIIDIVRSLHSEEIRSGASQRMYRR